VYRPPKIAPTSMDEDNDKMSKEERQARRREKELVRKSKQSTYLKEIIDDFQDKPEEVGCFLWLFNSLITVDLVVICYWLQLICSCKKQLDLRAENFQGTWRRERSKLDRRKNFLFVLQLQSGTRS